LGAHYGSHPCCHVSYLLSSVCTNFKFWICDSFENCSARHKIRE
jgi:hypothetical protein